MTDAPPVPTQAQLPQFGVIKGGLLDGWRFGLRELHVLGGRIAVDVYATPPQWPFPTLVRLDMEADFERLINPGEIAPYWDTNQLIKAALDRAKHDHR